MSEHKVLVKWVRDRGDFEYRTYTRNHHWAFEGETRVEASAAPGFLGDESRVDPEEALLASAASCHMLYFLAYAAKAGFTMTSYEDNPEGKVEKNEAGDPWVSAIIMRPRAVFIGDKRPTGDEIEKLHHRAHKSCIIANSLKSALTIEPIIES